MSLKTKLILVALVILALITIVIRPYYLFLTQTLKVSPLKTFFSIGGPKTVDSQVNILLLGVADASHDGPNLSDSITVINYNFKTHRLTSISLPRDVWSPTLRQKINAAYAYGYATKGTENQPESTKVQNGFNLAKAEISSVVGLPIQYAIAINFSQFKEIIDFLGGVDVNVANAFDDYAFPIPNDNLIDAPCGHTAEEIRQFTESTPSEEEIWKYFPCRYEHIHFNAGMTHMDGQTALTFVRSRHSVGPEGTDFAREARQQKVIEAIKNKLFVFVRNPDINAINKLYDLGDQLVKRDISNQQLAILAKDIILGRNFKQDKIVLTDDFFINPTVNLERYDYLWVLIPKNNDINSVHEFISCRLNMKPNCDQLKPK